MYFYFNYIIGNIMNEKLMFVICVVNNDFGIEEIVEKDFFELYFEFFIYILKLNFFNLYM